MKIYKKLSFILLLFWFANLHGQQANETIKPEKKVLIVVTSNDKLADGTPAGYYLPEVISFYKVLNKAGFEMDIASPKGGKAPMYSREKFVQYPRIKSQLEQTDLLEKLDKTIPIEQVDASNYSTIYYVGGFACLFDFPDNEALANIGATIYENEGVVAAVCHGPSGLLNIKLSNGKYLIQGKTLTSRTIEEDTNDGKEPVDSVLKQFPFLVEQKLIEKGAQHTKANPWHPHVEVCERLVTGQGPSSTKRVAISVVELLTGNNLFTIENFSKLIEEKGVAAAIQHYNQEKERNSVNFFIEEGELNTVGYELLKKDQNEEAIEVFKLIVNDYPKSWNAYDSLGDAYNKKGDRELAVTNYKKSLNLNPDNKNAEEVLEKLNSN